MPASVEAVIEIVARGQREVEAAFDQTGKAMERVAGQTEAVLVALLFLTVAFSME